MLDSISGAIYAPNSNGTTGYVAKAASPYVSNKIGEYFKDNKADNKAFGTDKAEVGSPEHIFAHFVLGAATSYATGNDALTGGVSAGALEATAPIISKYLYKTDDPSTLTAEQKDTISAITSLTAIAIGATTGDVTDTVNAVETSKVSVEDNTIMSTGKGVGYDISDGQGLVSDLEKANKSFLQLHKYYNDMTIANISIGMVWYGKLFNRY